MILKTKFKNQKEVNDQFIKDDNKYSWGFVCRTNEEIDAVIIALREIPDNTYSEEYINKNIKIWRDKLAAALRQGRCKYIVLNPCYGIHYNGSLRYMYEAKYLLKWIYIPGHQGEVGGDIFENAISKLEWLIKQKSEKENVEVQEEVNTQAIGYSEPVQ